ncbi:hypothetical protein MRF4_21305 [Methylobacterium radiotolerans]
MRPAGRGAGSGDVSPGGTCDIAPGFAPASGPVTRPRPAPGGPGTARPPPPREPIPEDGADAGRAVLLAGLATVLILGAALLLL